MSRALQRGRREARPTAKKARFPRRSLAGFTAVLIGAGVLPATIATPALAIEGFTLNNSDLAFILDQIQISERHAATPADPNNPCAGLLGPGLDQIPNQGNGVTLPWGLRTVDGTCNNLMPGQAGFGAADETFPRRAPEQYVGGYANLGAGVVDPQPRQISNLIVDQTSTNPAAVDAWMANQDPGAVVPTGETLFIPNTAPDVGLSSPYNSMFTLFGQFFDHGLDLVPKTGSTVFVPLQPGDPLYVQGAPTNFMVLTRATTANGDPVNQTSSFVDQSQTYTSHPSHQVFLREYAAAAGGPVSTGDMLTGPQDGLATWTATKDQARTLLGIALTDQDVLSVPLLATDQYGRFIPGPNGLPQLVVADAAAPNGQRLVEGNLTSPVATTGAVPTGHAFLDDIAHHAAPFGDHDRNPGTPPQALTPDTDPGTAPDPSPATYDDEMLGAHFVAGDGRINENIGLTSIHHVFHSEHNRLAVEMDGMINGLPAAQQAEWDAVGPSGWGYGERLFQAARFVTEMQYQHLAFEEFARKVQPMVNLFAGYDTSINAAIPAEFAHAVYRFGHSMLTETVARTGNQGDIPLLDAFLDPTRFYENGATPEQAVGNIARGMTDQVGNELDEFVTEALRNELLGLPLDLATLNLARGRDTGIPPLNAARAAFHSATGGNSALAPYQNWIDFGLGLRHPDSLINFVAAYGTHSTITNATTPADKRTAAARLVANDPLDTATPPDAEAFMNGTDGYANGGGLNSVDLWVGGLAERQSPFGGLLGSTFNYIFETTMEDLQDGDRFYYLTRTAGLNLLVQLEGNSFAELISRNSDATNLPADVFARLDMTFDVSKLGTSGPIPDDPATPWNETAELIRMADGTIRYTGTAHVMFIGTEAADRARTNEGDDTLRGNGANDRLEGEAGNDQYLGGGGNDVLTDTFGDDVLKGGEGNDALSSGPGFDLNQGQLGDDFVVGGSDPTETFGGPGDDIVYGGESSDTVFGDDGNDWIEGGGQADLLQGDNGAPFQDDPNTPGHDVIDGDGGNDDYDAEGGNDVMIAGPGIERNEGMLGFDWVTHKNDPQAANDNMGLSGLLPPSVDALRDRFDMVEGLSGGNLNDILRGDDDVVADQLGNELDQAGIDMVAGLAGLLGGQTSFTGGNMIIGGQGSDQIEGRGGNDLIDGDAWFNVQLSAGGQLYDSLNSPPAGATGPTLRELVFAGTVDPGTIEIVRSIVPSPGTGFNDIASFSGPRAEYAIAATPTGLTVTHTGGTTLDGVDTLRNIERLRFADGTVVLPTVNNRVPAADATGVAVNQNINATFSEAVTGVSTQTFVVRPTSAPTSAPIPGTVTQNAGTNTWVLNPNANLLANTQYTVTLTGGAAAIRNAAGVPLATTSWNFTTAGDTIAPTVTARVPAPNATGVVRGANLSVTFSEVVQGVTTAPTANPTFTVAPAAGGAAVGAVLTPTTLANGQQRYTLNPNANLAANTLYRVTVTGGTGAIRDLANNPLATLTWTFTTGS